TDRAPPRRRTPPAPRAWALAQNTLFMSLLPHPDRVECGTATSSTGRAPLGLSDVRLPFEVVPGAQEQQRGQEVGETHLYGGRPREGDRSERDQRDRRDLGGEPAVARRDGAQPERHRERQRKRESDHRRRHLQRHRDFRHAKERHGGQRQRQADDPGGARAALFEPEGAARFRPERLEQPRRDRLLRSARRGNAGCRKTRMICNDLPPDQCVESWANFCPKRMTIFAACPGSMETSTVFSPNFSCQAASEYRPGGRFSMRNSPSTSETAKYGFRETPR